MKALLCLVLATSCLAHAQTGMPNGKQIVIAHRGASAYAPEHTFHAYDLALEMGTDMLECDLILTKDEVPVCIHDETVDRTTGNASTGRVDSYTLAELRTMDFGSWFNTTNPTLAKAEYVGAKIVPFEEELDCYLRHNPKMRFHVETKDSAGGRAEDVLLALLQRKGLLATGDIAAGPKKNYAFSTVLVQSFDANSLARIRSLNSTIPTGFLFAAPDATSAPWLAAGTGPAYIDAYIPNSAVLLADTSAVSRFHLQGHDVHTWTVNDSTQMDLLLGMGIDGAFTNNTDLLRAAIDKRGSGTSAAERGNPVRFAKGCPTIAGRVSSNKGPGDVWRPTGARGVELVGGSDGGSGAGGPSAPVAQPISSANNPQTQSSTRADTGRYGGGALPFMGFVLILGLVRRYFKKYLLAMAACLVAACGDSGIGMVTPSASISSGSGSGGTTSSGGAGSSSSGGSSAPTTRETTLKTTTITESSGLARSQRDPKILWTHNDSGGNAEGYALDTDGNFLGTLALAGGNTGGTPITAQNQDWEDMASITLAGKPYLVFADIGDNNAFRPSLTLYVVAEPDLSAEAKPFVLTATPTQVITLTYPDGPRDAECIALDSAEQAVYIVSKRDAQPMLYTGSIAPPANTGTASVSAVVLTNLGQINIPRAVANAPNPDSINWVTGCDMSQLNSAMLLVTPTSAYHYPRTGSEAWFSALSRAPATIAIPQYSQTEAITFALDGKSFFISSENAPYPLAEIPLP